LYWAADTGLTHDRNGSTTDLQRCRKRSTPRPARARFQVPWPMRACVPGTEHMFALTPGLGLVADRCTVAATLLLVGPRSAATTLSQVDRRQVLSAECGPDSRWAMLREHAIGCFGVYLGHGRGLEQHARQVGAAVQRLAYAPWSVTGLSESPQTIAARKPLVASSSLRGPPLAPLRRTFVGASERVGERPHTRGAKRANAHAAMQSACALAARWRHVPRTTRRAVWVPCESAYRVPFPSVCRFLGTLHAV
jgi:hypothetical protein